MNQTINVGGSAGLGLGVAAAGLLLAYAIWVGRRDLGLRAALGILGSAFLATAPTVAFLFVPFTLGRSPGWNALFLVVTAGLSLLLSFFPLYVAANWLEIIRRAARPDAEDSPA